jgi:SPP1 family predicted phage head-tail adaptor
VAKEVIKRKNRISCIGDMRERVKLHDRALRVPEFGSSDFTENFSGTKTVWANVKTVSGQTFFTGANIDVSLTHSIIIRYDESVTSETWVELNNNNLKIISVEDLDERHEFLRLRCTERGDKDLGAAQA